MFEGIHEAGQAMLWLAIIEAAGFTVFTALAILPLVKLLKDYTENATRIHREQMDILTRQMSDHRELMDVLHRLVMLLEGKERATVEESDAS